MQRNFHRITMLLATTMLLGITGCPGSDPSTPATSTVKSQQPPATGAQAALGGTVKLPLRIAVDDPTLTSLDFADARLFALARCIAVPLVRSDANGTLSSGLADSWSTDNGGATWRFALKELDPEAPSQIGDLFLNRVEMILRQHDGALSAQLADLVQGASEFKFGNTTEISGIEVSGSELTITLTRKYAGFPLWISQPGMSLMPGYDWPGEDGAQVNIGGFAQFTLSEVDNGVLVLAPIDAPVVGTKALVDALHFVCEPDIEQQFELYKNGELHVAEVPYFEVPSVEGEEKLAAYVIKHETAAPYLGCFDLQQFPWGDSQFHQKLGLRQAVNWGLGRDYLEEATNGKFTAWPHFFPKHFEECVPSALKMQPTYPLTEQIEDARAALRRADHWQGIHLIPGMDLAWMEHEPFEKLSIECLQFWEDISVKMKPLPDPKEVLQSRVDSGAHEIVLRRVYPAYSSPEAIAYPQLHSSLAGKGGNWSRLEDSAVDSILDQAMASDDEGAKVKLYQQLSKQLEEQALFVFLGYSTPTLVFSPDLAGYELTPYDFDASLPAQDFAKLGLL